MSKKTLLLVVAVIFLFLLGFTRNTYAEVIWQGTDPPTTSSSEDGSTEGGSDCSGNAAKYMVDCTGVSWVYYKYVGGDRLKGQSIYFRPGSDKVRIGGECAQEGRGFWHFGINAKAFSYGGFANYDYLKGYSDDKKNTYLSSSGKWGHRQTYKVGKWKNTKWIVYKKHSNSKLNDKLYYKKDGKYYKIYEATMYDSRKQKRVEAAYGREVPDNVYAFCAADPNQVDTDHTLYVEKRNIYDGSYIEDDGKDEVASDDGWVGYTRDGVADAKFIGWKYGYNGTAGITGLLKRTSATASGKTFETYLDPNSANTNTNVIYYEGDTMKTIYRRIMADLSSKDQTVGAYYAPICRLTIEAGAGSSVAVNRTGGIYAMHGDLLNGSSIYKGDVLRVSASASTGFSLKSLKINGKNRSSGYSYTVGGSGGNCENVTVAAGAEPLKRTLNGYAVTEFRDSDKAHKYLKTDGTVSDWATSAPTNAVKVTSGAVNYGSSATVSFNNYNPAGHSFSYWGTSCPEASRNGKTCTIDPLEGSDGVRNVFAYYTRNAFLGRARVKGGTTVDDTNSTGYINSSDTSVNTKSINIDCGNAGCKASFDLALKATVKGSNTRFRVGGKANNGDISWVPPTTADGTTFSASDTNGTVVNSHTGNEAITLMPGNSQCYYLRYKPYGSYNNDKKLFVGACATAKVTYFEGKSTVTVSGAASVNTTDWQKTNTSKTFFVNDCSATDGCDVTFKHEMKRKNSIGTSEYNVSRESNYISSTKAVSTKAITKYSEDNVAFGYYNDSAANGTTVSTKGPYTLFPGMVVCEKLTFKKDNTSGAANVYTRVCASAKGKAQPDDPGDSDGPEGDNAFVNIKVKNNDVAAYNQYQRAVYAKPGTKDNPIGDKVTFRATYNPVLQYTYNLRPQKMQIDRGRVYPTNGLNTTSTLATMFNTYKPSSLQGWNNGFDVYSNNFTTASFSQGYKYVNGNTDKQEEYNVHTVERSEVGKKLGEIAKTNNSSDTKTTPGQVEFTENSGNNLGNVDTTPRESKEASVYVPYNYTNSTELYDRGDDEPLYAGEKARIRFKITTEAKRNNVTDGTYATKVAEASWKLVVSFTDVSDGTGTKKIIPTTSKNGVLNENGKLDGDEEDKEIEINVPDLPAGSDVCVQSVVSPKTSGEDTNWDKPEGDGQDAASGVKCFKVAKRPSIQVWGGNTYTRGRIDMTDAVKNNLAYYGGGMIAGYDKYAVEGDTSRNYVFGSWTELGLIASGQVKGLSSGASLGYAKNNNGSLWPSYNPGDGMGNNSEIYSNLEGPGGSGEASLCKRSRLTFANTCNTDGVVGQLGSSTAASNADDDKSAIISKFIFGGDTNIADAGNVLLNSESNLREGTNVYYYNGGSDALTIPGNAVNKGTIQVVHTKNDIVISGNIEYQDEYATLEDIPKLVIYAEKDSQRGGTIKINCDVTRIDAVLIADNVITCNNLDDNVEFSLDEKIKNKINDQINSRQLKINGAVITGKLYPNRTYGASTGANSMIPAEIINFDPTLYTWGATTKMVDAGGDDNVKSNLDITYRKELAPRL